VRIELPTGTPAELARPDGSPTRGLVVAPDVMGLRRLFDELVARLATENGWVVCAPEPFPGQESLPLDRRMGAVASLHDDRQVGDLVAAADACEVEPVGILGFCMGGMYAMKAVASGRFDRAAPFYGMIRLPAGWEGPGQQHAIDVLAAAPGSAARVLAVVGTADPYTPANDVDDLAALGAAVVRYDGAEHGFVHDPARPAHRADDAADAWRRVLAWLRG
jgi:carboxymethylenebutenolidase